MLKAKILAVMLVLGGALVGCDASDGPAESAGERVDNAVEKTKENVEDAAEEAEDRAEDAADLNGRH